MLNKKKKCKKLMAMIMVFALASALFIGCGSNSGNAEIKNEADTEMQNNSDEGEKKNSNSIQEPEQNTAMGRYVESTMDLSEYCSSPLGINKLADGTLIISDRAKNRIISKDNGNTWERESAGWFTEMIKKINIRKISYGADGTIGVIYYANTEDQRENTVDEEENDNDTSENDGDFRTEGFIVKPDGTKVPFEISLTEDDSWISDIWVSDSGRVFVTTLGENIYEVKQDGSSEKFLTVNGRPELIEFHGNLMMIDGSRFDGLVLYDIEKKEAVEDEVLNQFINENYKNRGYNTQDCYDIYFFAGEEGVIYLAGEKGLHRHVIGGSVMEQVIDGNLSSFSNPAYLLQGMKMLPNNEFLALFQGKKLVRFTYDPDIPTVPNNKLNVYSLKENDTLRQAVSIYQSNHPEVYVKYETGIEKESSVTRDDALKKLNTQIMAGQGPDVIILDDMPVDSYIEKGMLLDLSEYLNGMNEENKPFDNIADAFKKEGKIYTIPCEIQLPMLEGKEKYVSQVKNLKDFADMVETIRKDMPEKDILGICSEKGIMRLFTMLSESDWKTGKGDIDREVLKEFLQQTKRIYDAQMDGIDEKYVKRYARKNESILGYYGVSYDESDFLRYLSIFDIVTGYTQVSFGTAYYRGDITQALSVSKKQGFEDDVVIPMGIDDRKVFLPKTLIGINAASSQIQEAVEMMETLLGKENQTSLFNGFPVTKAGLEEGILTVDQSWLSVDGIYESIGASDEDGLKMDLEVYWFTEEQKQFLRDWLTSLNTPYIPDSVLEEAVYSEGIRYIRGSQRLEETVNAIEQKVSIYMAE